MPCIAAFIVLGIMSIFSATHRSLAKEAFDCVFRRVTFRPCNTGFQEKIKASFTARFVVSVPWLAKLINKHFELLSWVFMILTLGSLFWALQGLYFFYLYGSCNGLNDTGVCVLDIRGENNQISACGTGVKDPDALTTAGVDTTIFAQTSKQSDDEIIFIGCVNCAYTREVYQTVYQLALDKNVNFRFAHYPVKPETDYLTGLLDCAWTLDENQYWPFLSQLFINDTTVNASSAAIIAQAATFGYSSERLSNCLTLPETATAAAKLEGEVEKTGLYGTPLVFIKGEALVGPKPKRVYEQALNSFQLF